MVILSLMLPCRGVQLWVALWSTIAATVSMSEFDVARVMFGLVSTGVVLLRQPPRASTAVALPAEPRPMAHRTPSAGVPGPLLRGAEAFRRGALGEGISTWSAFLEATPGYSGATAIRDAVVAASRLAQVLEQEVPLER